LNTKQRLKAKGSSVNNYGIADELKGFLRIGICETVDGRVWYQRFHLDFPGVGGVISPAGDAARFVMAFLSGGELDGGVFYRRRAWP
jgi:hypothetical protein